MSDEQKMYGLNGWEYLETDVEDVIDRVFDDACEVVGESSESIAARLTWPIHIRVYRKMELPPVERISERILECVLEYLDEDYSEPDGDPTGPTQQMKEAALICAKIIRDEYKPYAWGCEPTTEIISVTKEEAIGMID